MKQKQKREPISYVERSYRQKIPQDDLFQFEISVQQTDLHIQADRDVQERCSELILQYRLQVEEYISRNPLFGSSLLPLPMDSLAPPMVRMMLSAAITAGVGPMAAVAGTIAQCVGHSLMEDGVDEIVVENGGDIFLNRSKECIIGIYAGESPLSYKVGLQIFPGQMPCGICTSSGTIGHSLSLGKADSVTVVADSVALADSVATRLGNEVGDVAGGKAGLENALAVAQTLEGIRGVVVICGDHLGAFGGVKLVKLDEVG